MIINIKKTLIAFGVLSIALSFIFAVQDAPSDENLEKKLLMITMSMH